MADLGDVVLRIRGEVAQFNKALTDAMKHFDLFGSKVSKNFKSQRAEIKYFNAVMGELDTKLKVTSGRFQLWGAASNSTKDSIKALNSTINKLLAMGLKPTSTTIATLNKQLDRLKVAEDAAGLAALRQAARQKTLDDAFKKSAQSAARVANIGKSVSAMRGVSQLDPFAGVKNLQAQISSNRTAIKGLLKEGFGADSSEVQNYVEQLTRLRDVEKQVADNAAKLAVENKRYVAQQRAVAQAAKESAAAVAKAAAEAARAQQKAAAEAAKIASIAQTRTARIARIQQAPELVAEVSRIAPSPKNLGRQITSSQTAIKGLLKEGFSVASPEIQQQIGVLRGLQAAQARAALQAQILANAEKTLAASTKLTKNLQTLASQTTRKYGAAMANAAKNANKVAAAHRNIASVSRGGFGSLQTALYQLAAAYAVVRGAGAAFKAGLDFTSMMESAGLAIASVVSATNEIKTPQGRILEGAEKIAAAQEISRGLLHGMRQDAASLGIGVNTLVSGFQAAAAPAAKIGLSLKDTKKFSTDITIALRAMNIPLDQQRQEIQDILNADIDRNSHLAKNLGLTTATLKQWQKQGTFMAEMTERLKDYVAAGEKYKDTWVGITSIMGNAFDMLMGANVEQWLGTAKTALKDFTKFLQSGEMVARAAEWGKVIDTALQGAYVLAQLIGNALITTANVFKTVLLGVLQKLASGVGIFAAQEASKTAFKTALDPTTVLKKLRSETVLPGEDPNSRKLEIAAIKILLRNLEELGTQTQFFIESEEDAAKRLRDLSARATQMIASANKPFLGERGESIALLDPASQMVLREAVLDLLKRTVGSGFRAGVDTVNEKFAVTYPPPPKPFSYTAKPSAVPSPATSAAPANLLESIRAKGAAVNLAATKFGGFSKLQLAESGRALASFVSGGTADLNKLANSAKRYPEILSQATPILDKAKDQITKVAKTYSVEIAAATNIKQPEAFQNLIDTRRIAELTPLLAALTDTFKGVGDAVGSFDYNVATTDRDIGAAEQHIKKLQESLGATNSEVQEFSQQLIDIKGTFSAVKILNDVSSAMEHLRLSAVSSTDDLNDAEQQLGELINAYKKLAKSPLAASNAVQKLGKQLKGAQLTVILAKFRVELDKSSKVMRMYGSETERLQARLSILAQYIDNLADAVASGNDEVIPALEESLKEYELLRLKILGIGGALSALGGSISSVAGDIGTVVGGLQGLQGLLGIRGTILEGIIAVTAGIGGWVQAFGNVIDNIPKFAKAVTDAFATLGPSVASAALSIYNAVSGIVTTLLTTYAPEWLAAGSTLSAALTTGVMAGIAVLAVVVIAALAGVFSPDVQRKIADWWESVVDPDLHSAKKNLSESFRTISATVGAFGATLETAQSKVQALRDWIIFLTGRVQDQERAYEVLAPLTGRTTEELRSQSVEVRELAKAYAGLHDAMLEVAVQETAAIENAFRKTYELIDKKRSYDITVDVASARYDAAIAALDELYSKQYDVLAGSDIFEEYQDEIDDITRGLIGLKRTKITSKVYMDISAAQRELRFIRDYFAETFEDMNRSMVIDDKILKFRILKDALIELVRAGEQGTAAYNELLQELNALGNVRLLERLKEITDTFRQSVTSGLSEAIKGFIAGTANLGETLYESIKNAVLSAITDALIEAAVVKGAFGNMLANLVTAVGEQNWDVARSEMQKIVSEIPVLSANLVALLDPIRKAFQGTFGSSKTEFKSEDDAATNVTTNLPQEGYASGGIVRRMTTALVGEGGPEAIIPLSKPIFDLLGAGVAQSAPLSGAAVGGNALNIYITGNTISSEMDIDRIGDQLVKRLRQSGMGFNF